MMGHNSQGFYVKKGSFTYTQCEYEIKVVFLLFYVSTTAATNSRTYTVVRTHPRQAPYQPGYIDICSEFPP